MKKMPNHCMMEKSALVLPENVTVAAFISPKRLCLIYLGYDHIASSVTFTEDGTEKST